MKFSELVIIISKLNPEDGYEEIESEGAYLGVTIRNSLSDIASYEDAFLITDMRDVADEAKKLGVGFCAYLNEISKTSDFKDSLYMIDSLNNVGMGHIERMYQRFLNIPWHILDTKRLSLDEMTVADLDGIYGIYDDPMVARLAGEPYYDREKAIDYIKSYSEYQYRFYEYGIWLVREKVSGEIIGRAGITGRAGYEKPELGYVFAKRAWGKGFATEAIEAILKYARDELCLDSINAFVIPENAVSVHILKKFGFEEIKKVMLHDEEHIYMQLEL